MYTLRKALGSSGRLRTQQGGYIIDLRVGDFLDLSAFRCLRTDGLRAAAVDDLQEAARSLEQALGLWREPALTDLPQTPTLSGTVSALVEERTHAQEVLVDVQLALGQHRELVPRLRGLTSSDPLRERYWEQLMLALYRSGHQAAALDTYTQARSVLAQECGISPGPGLRDLQQRMLVADPGLDFHAVLSRKAPTVAGGGDTDPPALRTRSLSEAGALNKPVMPRQLPGTVSHFIGRRTELNMLTTLLVREDAERARVALISAICGTAGVGKTALALEWAHQVAERFPDGQLYVNLRGYGQSRPLTSGEALFVLLLSLGVPGRDIPAEDEERAIRYQRLLSGRRMLIVLDNARDVGQVRPLLPGTAMSATVVTSRDSLAGLVARDGAHRIDLDTLPSADAITLLVELIGARAVADIGVTTTLAEQCCRLPLALRVAAELALARPAASLASLVHELSGHRRLDLLDAAGDQDTALRAVFSWSTCQLDPEAVRGFRMLGLHPGSYIDRHVLAALTDRTAEQAQRVLSVLSRAHLIQPAMLDKYGIHDLLRSYAHELATNKDETERRAALTRLFDYYVHTAIVAANTLYPRDLLPCPVIQAPATPAPDVTGGAAARRWLDSELASLVMVATHTADQGWPHHTISLSEGLARYLNVGGHFTEAATIHGRARSAALQIADLSYEANALGHLGGIEARRARNEIATSYYIKAQVLYQELGDRPGEASAEHNLGLLDMLQARYPQARRRFRHALSLYEEAGMHYGAASALTNLGLIELLQGRCQKATADMREALALCEEAGGDQLYPAYTLANLGLIALRSGNYQSAEEHLHQALALYQDTGYKLGMVYAQAKLGLVDLHRGRPRQAEARLVQTLEICRQIGDHRYEPETLNSLGEVYLATARPDKARIEHDAAITQATLIGNRYEEARAYHGLGAAYEAMGDRARARRYWREALTIYDSIGTPEAEQVRARLGDCPADSGSRVELRSSD